MYKLKICMIPRFAFFIVWYFVCCLPVEAAVDLTVTGTSPYSALDITSNFNAQIASLTENWISGTGAYSLKVSSTNGGLTHATQSTSKITYTLSYTGSGGTTVTVTTVAQTVGTKSNSGGAAAGSLNSTASIAYTGVAATGLYQGVYSDTLSFTWAKTSGSGQATVTRTLTLTAVAIGSTLAFSVTPNATASNLPLTASQTDLVVATALESSNSTTGYLIKVRSQNGGSLYNTSVGGSPAANQKIDYTLSYGGASATLSPANTDATIKTVATGLYNASSANITLSYTTDATSKTAGSYSDSLTFTIQAQ